MKIKQSFYIDDILSQPRSLRDAVSSFDADPLKPIADIIRKRDFDRIILTGMGASFYALYPTWSLLSESGLPVIWTDTSELLHYAHRLITSRTLIWIISQSGRSAEIVSLLESFKVSYPAAVIATTNDFDSPLASIINKGNGKGILIPINAEPEKTVSTRTYINTLALCQLTSQIILGKEITPVYQSLNKTADIMESYLSGMEDHLNLIEEKMPNLKYFYILGRGSSLASVYCGMTIIGEASKLPVIGMAAGQFRHGPLETCSEDITVAIFAGDPTIKDLNLKLAHDIENCKAHVVWIGSEKESYTMLPIPQVDLGCLPMIEILPMQFLSIYFANKAGIVPGEFHHIGKVTLKE